MLKIKQPSVVLLIGALLLYTAIMVETICAQSYENSPFGFHPASVFKPGYPNNGFIDAENIGVRWHRPPVYAFWFIVQPDTGDSTLDFNMYDNIYGDVPEDINILANIAPQGHRIDEGYCLPGSYLPIDSAKYVRFVKATVERYDSDGIDDMPGLVNPVKFWQVSNEPSATHPTDFAKLQRITYRAIKDACTDCQVLVGGALQPMTPSGFTVDIEEYLGWFSIFYEPILEELNGECVDIFDFHWYGNATGDYHYCGEVFDSLRAILARHNFGDIPVWTTEMGAYSGDPVDTCFHYQTEAQQAGDYLKRFVFPLSIGVKKIFPAFGLMESFKHEDGYFDHTGLIYDGEDPGDLGLGVKKLGYFTYKLMTQKLEESDWDSVETIDTGVDFVYLYSFLKDTLRIYVAWYDYFSDSGYSPGDTIQFVLHDIDNEQVIVTNAMPYDTLFLAFNVDTLVVTGDSVIIQLGKDPVFIEELFSPSVEENRFIAPKTFYLSQNCPNPFNLQATVSYHLPLKANVTLKIYNLAGKVVEVLVDKSQPAGYYTLKWNSMNDNGKVVPSGVYFIKLKVGDEFPQTEKLLLLR